MILFILDFDNTLADTYGPYGEGNIFRNKTLENKEKAAEIYENCRRGADNIVMFKKLLEEYNIDDPWKFFEGVGVPDQLFPDSLSFLEKLQNNPEITSTILTTGDEEFQKIKTTLTGVDKFVDELVITRNRNKKEEIEKLIQKYQPEKTVYIDDRPGETSQDFSTQVTVITMDRTTEKCSENVIHGFEDFDFLKHVDA